MSPSDQTDGLDPAFVRSQFPAFDGDHGELVMAENAGGSYACRQTIDALRDHYTTTKVQPYYPSAASTAAGGAMDAAFSAWALALGVADDEVHVGPSTTANTTTLAAAFGEVLGAGDEVIVTDQDHEANRGPVSRAAARAGATVRVWGIDPDTGLLDLHALDDLLSAATRVVHLPHVSNIVGVENDVAAATAMIRAAGAVSVVDGVSAVPHGIPDVGALGADVYLCSLYKVFSVHQGLMTVRRDLLDRLPNQSHFFNDGAVRKRLVPAGPDHAQVAAARGVLDYVTATAAHHGDPTDDLGVACRAVARRWRRHEDVLVAPVLDYLDGRDDCRLLGPSDHGAGHRCPTVAFAPSAHSPAAVAADLGARGVAAGSGFFYSWRTLQALGIDPTDGVVRLSFVHYNTVDEVSRALTALDEVLGRPTR